MWSSPLGPLDVVVSSGTAHLCRTSAQRRALSYFPQPMKRLLRLLGVDIVRYPSRTHSPLAQFLKDHKIRTVIDVGANVGQYALRLRQLEGFGGQIVSIEPDPTSFDVLSRRASRDSRWTALRTALGDRKSTATLHVAELSVFSSLRQPSAYGKGADRRIKARHDVEVPVTTLDSLLAERPVVGPVFLKIDTQGYERPIIAGARQSLHDIAGLQLELSLAPLYEGQPTIAEMLTEADALGFKPWAIVPGYVDPATGAVAEVDGLFVRTQQTQ